MALITAEQVIATVPFNKNLDTANIERMIIPVQIGDLQYVLGSGFYDGIIASGWMNDGIILSGLDSTASGLMANYVKPFLEWQVAVSSITFQNTQVTNNGLFSGAPQQTTKATAPEKNNVESKLQQYANVYRRELQNYLEANKTIFTVWRDECYNKNKSSLFKSTGIII